LKEYDAFVLCAEKEKKARSALETVIERATEALNGVAEETRDPLPDGTSRYSRPLPGAARMRPETDIPPVPITQDRLKRIYGGLPELPEETVKRFIMKYKLNEQQASQIVKEGYDGIFEKVAEDRDMISAAAATFIGTFTEMEREGTDVSSIQEDKILDIFSYLKRSKFAKEALPSVFREVAKGTSIDDAIFGLDLGSMSEEDAAKIIGDIVNERRTFVIEKGVAATGPLMGPMMEALRGKIDGKRMNEILTAEIKKIL
jgi:glutamyl-tRNA(Gln) amidotransferase subunit E